MDTRVRLDPFILPAGMPVVGDVRMAPLGMTP